MTSWFDSFDESRLGGFEESPLHERNVVPTAIFVVAALNESLINGYVYTYQGIGLQRWQDDQSLFLSTLSSVERIRGYTVDAAVIWLLHNDERLPIAPDGIDLTVGGRIRVYAYDSNTVPVQTFVEDAQQVILPLPLRGWSSASDPSGSMVGEPGASVAAAFRALRDWISIQFPRADYHVVDIPTAGERWLRWIARGIADAS